MRRAFLVLLASTALVSHANASTITFNNRAAWEAAAGAGVTTIGFEGLAPAGGNATFSRLVLSGVDFGAAVVDDPGVGSFISAWGTGAMLFGYGTLSPATITFSAPVTAFAFSYGATFCVVVVPCANGTVNLTLSSGDSVQDTGAMPPLRFVGVVSSVPVTSVSLQISPTFGVLDNFSFARSAPAPSVPEPLSALLLVTGLVAGVVRHRRRTGIRDRRR